MRIFLIDDDEDLRVLVRTWLELNTSYAVVGEAGELDDAIERLRDRSVDVIVTDLVMGAGPGRDPLIARLKAAAPQARLVVHSGHDPSASGVPSGVDRYVLKGAGLDTLTQALDSLS